MGSCTTLVTNNPDFRPTVKSLELIDGNSLDVLVAVRDRVHRGARLLNHPLYGNLRPDQQRYRSLLLQERRGTAPDTPMPVHYPSLRLLEEALAVYRAYDNRLPGSGAFGRKADEDCRYLDKQLLLETLRQYSMLLDLDGS
ncbi:MAG: GrdX family protein [Synergistales bacterium]|nr:GrdX family protein [Synergistales bacterium]